MHFVGIRLPPRPLSSLSYSLPCTDISVYVPPTLPSTYPSDRLLMPSRMPTSHRTFHGFSINNYKLWRRSVIKDRFQPGRDKQRVVSPKRGLDTNTPRT